ncbi:MAG: hypothetical protein MR283_01020 [Erysipelotrichaceae bacterium]|nr:hypothetical protein [Erysipelotrichaceae bacterium]
MNNFRRGFCFIISLFMLICIYPISFVSADNDSELTEEEKEYAIDIIAESISNIEQQIYTVTTIDVLYDINKEPTYILAELKPQGYAIFTRTKLWLSEYAVGIDSPYKKEAKQYKLYYGPHNYDSCNSLNITRRFSRSLSENNEAEQMIRDANERMLENDDIANFRGVRSKDDQSKPSKEPNHTPEEYDISWIGVSEDKMRLYNWGQYPTYTNKNLNPKGICGTVASTIMLAYSDDYVDNNIVPTIMRPQFSNTPGRLYEAMWYAIDFPHQNGTFPTNLVAGINEYFNTYQKHYGHHGYLAYFNLLNSGVFSQIRQDRVICLGLVSLLGSEYGDHWVARYAVSDDFKYYKCIDTWVGYTDNGDGSFTFSDSNNYRAVVNANWVASNVCLYK